MQKVVLIDDEEWTRNALRSLGRWKDFGMEIVGEASDGEYALELINRIQPNIIITDVRMPNMNGIELLESLRRQGNNAIVIFVSGYSDFSYVKSALQLKAVDYLLKPVKPDELNNRLSACAEDPLRIDNSLQLLNLQNLFEMPWSTKYVLLRNTLCECLYSQKNTAIKNSFFQLSEFLSSVITPDFSKSILICIYYDLQSKLQQFSYTKGINLSGTNSKEERIFVFSSETSVQSILSFSEESFLRICDKNNCTTKATGRINIVNVQSYIEQNYLSGLTLEETAKAFFVSKEYLSKMFKSETGTGFLDYVFALRMQKAHELLVLRDIPIKEVSSLVGYTDQAHFHKAFKRFYGITPGEMKKNIKN